MADKEKDARLKRVGSHFDGDLPELEQVEMAKLQGKDIVITSAHFRKGDYGEYAIIIFRMPNSNQLLSTACGGTVICDKLHTLISKKLLPAVAKFKTVEGKRLNYTDME